MLVSRPRLGRVCATMDVARLFFPMLLLQYPRMKRLESESVLASRIQIHERGVAVVVRDSVGVDLFRFELASDC